MLALIGLWALALVPVLAGHHRATHVHVTCDHGEAIELEPIDALAAAHDAPSGGEAAVDDGRGATGSEDGHHHCTLGCPLATVLDAAPRAIAAPAAPPVAIVRAPLAVVRTAAVLAVAPKTSPPV